MAVEVSGGLASQLTIKYRPDPLLSFTRSTVLHLRFEPVAVRTSPPLESICLALFVIDLFVMNAECRGASLGKRARFGMVRNGGARPHQDVHFYAQPGTKVFAVASGEIVRIRHHDASYGQDIL